jgi:hypothetical protein
MRDERLRVENQEPPMSTAAVTESETGDRDVREDLDQVRLLAAWERLGQEDFAASPQELPPGFARYLFCLPSASLKNRSLPELSDPFAAGATL